MDSGLYTAYSGLKATASALDVVANNLANVNTTGFKSDETFLRIYNKAVADPKAGPLDGALNDSTLVRGSVSNFNPGVMKTTGNPLDVAIDGDGFLAVEGPGGVYYTRNGNLHTNANGQLVTVEGYTVLGAGGAIQVPPGRISISQAGEIQVDGAVVDTLRVVDFRDKRSLQKVGNSLFRNNGAEGVELEGAEKHIHQGALEQSNVNPVKEMMLMIDIMRQFESLQKTIFTMMNTVNDRSINQVGRVIG
ncbi:MAG TPA: flagellar basal-body rod protein FlgF [Terriglobia bacterium]|nr:flagellar basal-body rod protein FlgF [Terriglobia bacterium]